jgi:hypothetical protein
MDKTRGQGKVTDGEVVECALGLGAIKGSFRDLYVAHAVVFGAKLTHGNLPGL